MAYGFVPAYHFTGGVIRPREYTIAATYGNDLIRGDVVTQVAGGGLQIGVVGTAMVGVFYGVQYKTASGEMVFSQMWPANGNANWTDIKAYVYDDPYIVFQAQADQVGTALVAADVGANVDFLATAGNTTTFTSGHVIDSNTMVTTTASFRIMGSAQVDEGFTAAGTTMDVYVMPIEHLHRQAAGV